VYGKSAAEDLEDQLRFEEGDDDDAADALAHGPLTLLSQPSPPIVVPPPSSAPPPPAVPAPSVTPEGFKGVPLEPTPIVASADGLPGSAGAEAMLPQLQPQPANPVQADTSQGAQPAVLQTAVPAAVSDVQQHVGPSAAAAAAAAAAAMGDTQRPTATGSVAQDASAASTGKHSQPGHGRPDAAASTVAAEPAPHRGGAQPDSSDASSAGNASATAAVAAVTAAAAPPAAALVPQVIPAKQPEADPRLLALNADEKQFQLQLQSSRLGKSVYDLLVQVPLRGHDLSLRPCNVRGP
jgi:hypothetical protein